MISVRVNEILKYLSTDKKERLKKCVQVMESVQKLDSTRTQRNNIANAALSPSLSSSSSSCVSVTEGELSSAEESMSKAQHNVRSTAVSSVPYEGKEKKDGEKFNRNASDKKLTKDCKKRRPLTVLKCQNIQCMRVRSQSISENSPSFPDAKSQNIPKNSLLLDVKLNGLKPLVLSKSKVQTDPKTADLADELPVKKRSSKKSEKEISDLAKDCLRQIENPKHSKKTTTQKDEIRHSEDNSEQKPNVEGKEADDAEDPDPVLRPDAPSPSFTTSRKSRKPNKNKNSICGKQQEDPIKSCSRGSDPSIEGCCLDSLPDVGEPQCLKTPSGRDFEFSHLEKKILDLRRKEKKLEQIKIECGKLNGYKSASGVTELDTFEITSLRKKLLKKRHTDAPSSEALDELDTFDDPIATAVHRHSNESLGTVPTTQEMAEKWIEVNRKVKRVVVPVSALSRILGPDGSKLEAICNFTKAHIEQEKAQNKKEMVFVIRGTLEQMQAACSMISALTKDCDSQNSLRNGCTLPMNSELTVDLPLQKISEAKNFKEPKAPGKLQHLPVVNSVGNATGNKINSFLTRGIPGQQRDEEYQESVRSGTSERSDEPSSERSSPDQDLLIGEYSLFEHGLGQPLEKLLACKDSSKQTFAHAAGSRSSSRMLTIAMPNNCIVDQTLLAKAPGYRNVKSLTNHSVFCPKVGDFSLSQNGRMEFPWKCGEQTSRNETSFSSASHLLPIDSRNFSIPLLERPISAPSQPLPHSASGTEPTVRTSDSLAVHTFSNLNPNAPDFIFASSSEAINLNHLGDSRANRLLVPSVDASVCAQNGAEGGLSYVASFSRSNLKLPGEILDSAPDGATCQGPAIVTSEEAMYALPIGDGLGSSWIGSQGDSNESWNMPKMPFDVIGGEHVSVGTYPSRGEVYCGYFAHPTITTNSTSPYNCVYYQQQQHIMLAPIQSWVQSPQSLAQAGP